MARPLNDSPYLYGLHDPGGESVMAGQNTPGWILFTEELGADPNDGRAGDYSRWASQGFGILVRLNHGYEPNGTIPYSNRYGDFARRCANFVRNSQGCHIWIIGNEMNYPVERPGVVYDRSQNPPRLVQAGETITPGLYANCYRQCRAAIKAVPGHENDQVIIGAVAPWNPQTPYDGNPTGDWAKYQADLLSILGPANCDGVAVHAYTHGADPKLVYTDAFMNPPFQARQYNFRAYQDFMRAIPVSMRGLPVYLTEADQNDEWRDENTGWVQRIFGEVNWWNQQPGNQKIRSVILYRWPRGLDKWGIEGKAGVIEDFRQAMTHRYTWEGLPAPVILTCQFLAHTTPAQIKAGDTVAVTVTVQNTGLTTWAIAGPNPIRLAYFWMDASGQAVSPAGAVDTLTALPKPVVAGEKVQIQARLAAPPAQGTYRLQWDLLQVGGSRFSQQGSSALTLSVSVQPQGGTMPDTPTDPTKPADTSPIKFNETGRTAQGPFAVFYRRYGVDVTGFPISDQYVHATSKLNTQEWQRVVMEEYPPGSVRLRLAGQELGDLRQRVSALERQIATLQTGGGGPEAPAISDVTQQLPRDPAGFVARPREAIQYIVINHTGVRPEVTAERVAQAQRARWPGIVSQYYVTGDAQILQTNPVDQVVTRDQGWIYNGINIYVAGNFDTVAPSDQQIDALAHLCAWLMSTYSLAEAAIRGVSEFIVTHSPGLQWLSGESWKNDLLAKVRAIPTGPAVSPADLAALKAKVDALQNQVIDLQTQLTDAESRNAQLQKQLDDALHGIGGTPTKLNPPPMTDISPQLPQNPGALKARPRDQIKYLVINHTAVDPSVGIERIAASHQKRWGATLYQYFIAGDGSILQTNALDQVVDLTQAWIGQGVNIAIAGNFTADVPGEAQIQAAARLCAWLMQEYNIPVANVKGVSEFINSQSPGTQWMTGKNWKDTLLRQIAQVRPTTPGPATPDDSATVAVLRAHISQLEMALRQAQASIAALTKERDLLKAQIGQPGTTEAQLRQQIQTLTAQVASLTSDKTTLAQQVQALTSDKAMLTSQVRSLTNDKTSLTTQVQTLTSDKASLAGQVQTLTKDKTTLAGQVQSLTSQVQTLTNDKATLNQQIATLQQRIKVLEGGTGPSTPTTPGVVPQPTLQDIVDKLPKHATLKYDTRTLNKITHLAIHHSAAPANVTPERVAQYHVGQDWPGIGYHFYVEPDGTIFQTNRLETISYNVYMQNHYLVGICVSGTFTGVVPTPLQIEQTGHLVAWLMQKLNIPLERVWGHKEFPENPTACPGNDWMAGKNWKQMLQARIKQVQAGQLQAAGKTIGHYMLFWQRQDAWAQEDWQAAANYFAKFRPTTGFSPEDAKNAEYVSIVGGIAGVPYETEQMLIGAGCKVERLAGKDFADTKRMLDSLAQSGRRFQTFNV